jgi:hypothetical protein
MSIVSKARILEIVGLAAGAITFILESTKAYNGL